MTRLLLVILLLAFFPVANAQVYRNLTTANGLKNNNVYSIARDKEGFLWFLSSSGVDRFDGLDFINFNLNTANRPIGLKPVYQLVADNNGDIWQVGTANGDSIAFFDRDRGHFTYVHISGIAPEEGLRHLFVDRANRLWISSGKKVFIYDIASGKQTGVNLNFTSEIVCGAELSSGSYAIGMKKGVAVVSGKGNSWSIRHLSSTIGMTGSKSEVQEMHTVIPSKLNDLSVHKIVACGNDGIDMLVFDSQSRIYRVDIDKDLAKVSVIKKIYDTNITDIKPYFDDDNKLLIATEGRGVIVYDIASNEAEEYLRYHLEDKPGLRGNVVMSVLPDPSKKRVWFANYPYGVLCYNIDFPTYKHVSHEPGNPNTIGAGVVTAIAEDSDGDVWFATSSGVSCYRTSTAKWKHYLTDENRKNLTYLAVCEIRPGLILATGLMSGAFVIDKHTDEVRHITPKDFGSDNAPDRGIRSVYTDANGIIWIAGEEVLVRLDWDNMTYSSSPLASQAMAIKRKDDGHFWLVTLDGLYSVDILSGRKTKHELPARCVDINDVLSTRNGDLYIATADEGLFVKKNSSGKEEFRQYVWQNCGLLSNNIMALVEDASGKVFMSTDQGMTRYYPKEDAFVNWSHWQGMVSHGFYKKSAAHISNNTVLFGTNKGYVELDDSLHLPRVLESKIILSNLSINGEYRNVNEDFDSLRLGYNERQVAFSVGNLNYDNPFLINYQWRMDGTGDNWSTVSKNRRLNFMLTSGDYRLLLRATNGADHTVIEERTVHISVSPPWWESYPAMGFYALFLLLLLYAVHVISNLHSKRKLAEDKVNFFIQTAHDLRTPLTLIKAPLEEISGNENLTDRGKQNVQTALKSANDLIIFASDLLNMERQKMKKTCLHISQVNLNMYLQELIIPFQLYARTKHIDLTFRSPANGKVWIDRSRIDSIMYNLVNNALKYTPAEGSILIKANMSDEEWTVSISDTGMGMSDADQEKLSEMYYRTAKAEESGISGTGMGLFLVKKLVEEHCGTMTFTSHEDEGTTFNLTFPINYESQKNVVKLAENGMKGGQVSVDSPKVLVVEDSTDLREFMVRTLSGTYNIYTAENGQEAYSKIRFLHPDIVVSDVMMPLMRGDELCRKIKEDVETSHIPVILLTALADSDSVLEGLSTLADAYITKPFSVNLLTAQIDNLLSNRKSLQNIYSRMAIGAATDDDAAHTGDTAAGNVQTNVKDVGFIKMVGETVDKHMRDTEFNVDILCTEIGMSRTSFYNKLKSLTGYSPADYIRMCRIEHSKQLLLTTTLAIAEVSEACGFYDTKYFREVFRKNVGTSPREFRQGSTNSKH